MKNNKTEHHNSKLTDFGEMYLYCIKQLGDTPGLITRASPLKIKDVLDKSSKNCTIIKNLSVNIKEE